MDFANVLPSLIPKLRKLKHDSRASAIIDVMSGAFIWSDERLTDLTVAEMGCYRAILRYRTNRIVSEGDDRFSELWNELAREYPHWIGFDSARCNPSPDLVAQFNEYRNQPLL